LVLPKFDINNIGTFFLLGKEISSTKRNKSFTANNFIFLLLTTAKKLI